MATAVKDLKFGMFTPIVMMIAVIWAVQILNFLTGYALNSWFGLRPLTLGGLIGIPLSPFLHGGFTHAAANTIPLAILGGIALMVARERFAQATVMIVVIGGALVWAFAWLLTWLLPFVSARGSDAVHVGASGLVFGYFGFLVALGYYERSLRAIFGAVAAIVLYSGMFFALLRIDPNISIEGHIFGFVAGIVTASALRDRAKRA